MKALVLTGALLALLAPTGAQAATLVNSGGTLTYAGTAAINVVEFSQTSTVMVTRDYGDADPIAVTGCARTDDRFTERYACDGVASVVIDAGAGDDRIFASTASTQTVAGGPGDDTLVAARGTISGGSGIDLVRISVGQHSLPVPISLDGVANDGYQGGNVLADVEDLMVDEPISFSGGTFSKGPYALTGSDAANELTGGHSGDAITGGGGSDTLTGLGGDDTIDARDGVADRVSCGAGADSVLADTIDVVGEDCESVQRTPVAPFADRAPTVAWTNSTAKLAPGSPTTLEVTAGDDYGVTSVRFLDDGRALCTATAPPYTCSYQPRLQDIGPNLLVAVVTDLVGQTATISRVGTVAKFQPESVTIKVNRRGTRSVVTGTVKLPKGARCGGTVTVSAKGVRSRTVKLSKACAYRVAITAPKSRSLRFAARFDGTETVAAKRSVRART